jgi:AcrR family transcriptional regulator
MVSLAERHAARSLEARRAERSVEERRAEYVAEIEGIVEAAYRVIERTGSVEPTMREILREAGISTPAFYRHFRSKDELFVALLGDGRRRFVATIERRMARETTGAGQVRAWIGAFLAQARDSAVAARTRPFLAGLDRLAEQYPDEQRASEQLVIDQLAAVLAASDDLVSPDPQADATAIYHLAVGELANHLRHRTTPRPADVDRVVDFAMRALTRSTPNKGEHHG